MPGGVVGALAGTVVALFLALKAADCGFRCRRKPCCGRAVWCCVRLRRPRVLAPESTTGLYAPLGDGSEREDNGGTETVPNTQYTALFAVLLSLYRLAFSWTLTTLLYAADTAKRRMLWIQLTTIVCGLCVGVVTAGRFLGSLVGAAGP
jgi:hypothetical protein